MPETRKYLWLIILFILILSGCELMKCRTIPISMEGIVIDVQYQTSTFRSWTSIETNGYTTIFFNDGRVICFPNILSGSTIIKGKYHILYYESGEPHYLRKIEIKS